MALLVLLLFLLGCLLGFVGLVFGARALRWTLAFILFLPFILIAVAIYNANHPNPPAASNAFSDLLGSPKAPAKYTLSGDLTSGYDLIGPPMAPSDASASTPAAVAPQQPAEHWFYHGNLVDWGPFPSYEEAVATCKAYFIKCEESSFTTVDCSPGSPSQQSTACIRQAALQSAPQPKPEEQTQSPIIWATNGECPSGYTGTNGSNGVVCVLQ
jgi:hypothetical protein